MPVLQEAAAAGPSSLPLSHRGGGESLSSGGRRLPAHPSLRFLVCARLPEPKVLVPQLSSVMLPRSWLPPLTGLKQRLVSAQAWGQPSVLLLVSLMPIWCWAPVADPGTQLCVRAKEVGFQKGPKLVQSQSLQLAWHSGSRAGQS